jgi:putative NADPH-quinone reductase
MTRIVAIEGSYRKGRITDTVVEAILEGARAAGATTRKIRLSDQHIEFCTNCRTCTQQPGETRGKCPQEDDLEPLLQAVEGADVVVLASPVNYYNVTALFRRFLERLLGYVYWPWGQAGPKARTKRMPRRAVLVASAGMPGFLIPIATGAPKALRLAAKSMGARPVAKMWVGLASQKPMQAPTAHTLDNARKIGMRLA